MSQATTRVFESTLQTTHVWLDDLKHILGWGDREPAYHALRAVLHALRDRLPVTEAADLAAQLPMLIRGFYYEGWRPVGKPLREHKKQEFLNHVIAELGGRPDWDGEAERVTRAVFQLLSQHISPGEIHDVVATLPDEIRTLWPITS